MHKNTLEGGGQLHSETGRSRKTQSTFSRFIASVLAAMLSIAGLVAIGPAAYAAPSGITISNLHNGSALVEGAVVDAGHTLTLRVLYDDALEAGAPLVIGPPEGVTFDESALDVPAGNTAIEDISLDDAGNIQITFYDPADWTVNQGVYDLDFLFDEVDHTEEQQIQWTVDGEPHTWDVIVRKPGDEEANVSDGLNKGAGWA